MQHNCRGIRANYYEITLLLREEKPDVICFNETSLLDEIDFELPGYTVASRLDRATGRGGSLTALKQGLRLTSTSQGFDDHTNGHLEHITVTINTGSMSFNVVNVYSTPRYPLTAAQLYNFIRPNKNTLLVGDLNAKHEALGSRNNNAQGEELMTLVETWPVAVLNDLQPTHCHGNCLDYHIATTSFATYFTNYGVHDSLGSDHNATMSLFDLPGLPMSTNLPKRYDYKRADWDLFKDTARTATHSMQALWPPSVPTTTADIDNAVAQVTEVIQQAKDEAFPYKKKPHGTPLPHEVVELIKKKRALRKQKNRITVTNSRPYTLELHNRMAEIRLQLNRLTASIKRSVSQHKQAAEDQYWMRLKENENNQHKFWKLLKERNKPEKTSRPLKHGDDIARNDPDKAELFAKVLSERMQKPPPPDNDIIGPEAEQYYNDLQESREFYADETVQVQELQRAIRKTKIRAPGPDTVTNAEIKHLPQALLTVLCCIFTASLRLGYFPEAWKKATVKFIPKAGKNHSTVKGHRPITLLRCLAKLLESIVKTRLLEFTERLGILGTSQAAYRTNHSTDDQLLHLSQKASEALGFTERRP